MIWSDAFTQVRIIGHRGVSFLAPENTVARVKLSWQNNADAIECDKWL
jgi:glycerophosphoryl diester phosphodiesterase